MRTRYKKGDYVKFRKEKNHLRYNADEVELHRDTHIYRVVGVKPADKTLEGRTLYRLKAVTDNRGKSESAYASDIRKVKQQNLPHSLK